MIIPVECAFCSNIIEKKVETEPGDEGTQSTINVFCPFCGKWVNGSVPGKLSLKEYQLRRDEELKFFGFDGSESESEPD